MLKRQKYAIMDEKRLLKYYFNEYEIIRWLKTRDIRVSKPDTLFTKLQCQAIQIISQNIQIAILLHSGIKTTSFGFMSHLKTLKIR